MAQAFDSLSTKHTLMDLFETNVKTNAINLLHKMIKDIQIRIKSPVGVSEEREISSTIMQGETTSSILCTTPIGTRPEVSEVDPQK